MTKLSLNKLNAGPKVIHGSAGFALSQPSSGHFAEGLGRVETLAADLARRTLLLYIFM